VHTTDELGEPVGCRIRDCQIAHFTHCTDANSLTIPHHFAVGDPVGLLTRQSVELKFVFAMGVHHRGAHTAPECRSSFAYCLIVVFGVGARGPGSPRIGPTDTEPLQEILIKTQGSSSGGRALMCPRSFPRTPFDQEVF